ncbi:MAG: PQQ-binding-like beta-propeller repeat protein [Candidatus Latescibacterota bacterium]
MRCLEAASGRRLWEVRTEAAAKGAPAAGCGCCAVLEVTGRLHVLETASGQRRWSVDLPGHPERWIFTAPVVGYGLVFAGARAGYGAWDLDTGAQRWYTPLESGDNWSCHASPLLRRGLLVALVQRRGLVALRVDSGTLAWEQPLGVEYYYAAPVRAGDLLVTGGDPGHLAVLQATTGEVLWHQGVLESAYATGLSVSGETIYATASDGRVRAVDLHSGEVRWTFQSGPELLDMTPYRRGGASLLAAPAVRGQAVMVAGLDGVLYALLGRTGTCLGQASFGAPLSAAPAWGRQGLFVATYDGRLLRYC